MQRAVWVVGSKRWIPPRGYRSTKAADCEPSLDDPSSRRTYIIVSFGLAAVVVVAQYLSPSQGKTQCYESRDNCTNENCGKKTVANYRKINSTNDTRTTDSSSREVPNLDTLPIYTSEQVAQHDGNQIQGDPSIWMSLGGLVHDVTNFIPYHPGGTERILRASGSALELYWLLHRQHYDSEEPANILAPLVVGKLADSDQERVEEQVEELQRLQNEFMLVVRFQKDSSECSPLQFSLRDLQALPKTDYHGKVGCSQKQGLLPASSSLFGGVRMGDLLRHTAAIQCVLLNKDTHLQFTFSALDGESVSIEGIENYEDILICYEMNGAPLTQQRGFPLRIIIPGSRPIKWVHSIQIRQL